MSELKLTVLDASYNDDGNNKNEQRFKKFYKPPYRLAVEENGGVSVFGQVEHEDLAVMCGLVMELNAGRAGRGGKGKAPKRRWLFVDKHEGRHAIDGGSVLKSLGAAELRRRNKVYRLLHRDTGARGYVGPKAEVNAITDPTAIRVLQSNLGQMGAL